MKKRTFLYKYLKNIKDSIRRNIDNIISKKNSPIKKKPVIGIKNIDTSNPSIDFNINDEVKDLLKSDEWEEVNQGLEILASLQPYGVRRGGVPLFARTEGIRRSLTRWCRLSTLKSGTAGDPSCAPFLVRA